MASCFYAGMQIELQEDAGRLDFQAEHTLGSEPVRADLLIIRKTGGEPLKKRIGKIFRRYNVVEYKSPGHSLSIDAFYKACGYVNLYKAVTGGADEIKITDMTLTFACSCYPGKLIRHLENVRGFRVKETAPGIYYVLGEIIPIQIILIHKLAKEESRWLGSLTNRMTETEEISLLLKNYESHKDDPLYRTVMDVIVRANWKKFEEVRTEMCDALVELMEDYVEDRLKSEYDKGMKNGRDKEREAGIKSLIHTCRNLGIPRQTATLQLSEQYRLSDESAEEYVEKFWKE